MGLVTVIKRSTNRYLRLTIATGGDIKVSIPSWASYQAGLDFARSKSDWINVKRPQPILLSDNQPIGRAHRLYFKPIGNIDKSKSRVSGSQIIISHPINQSIASSEIQAVAIKASTKALRKQAENLLPQRLKILSVINSLDYKDVTIKQLSRRWGSCDQNKSIVLNLFLIQLPWELIDYVILHELTHTKHLNHSPEFWNKLETMAPNARTLKKCLNNYRPDIIQA